MLMLTGCSDKASSSKSKPSDQPAVVTDLPDAGYSNSVEETQNPIKNLNQSNVYISTSLMSTSNKIIELSDAAYYMTIDSYLHWQKNQKALPIKGSLPHSVKDTQKISTLPNSENKKAIVIDAWGESAKNKARFQLTQENTVSVVDLKDSSLDIASKGALTTLAFRMENTNLTLSSTGTLKTHVMYVDTNSQITNGQMISYTPESIDQFGMSMKDLNSQRHRRFPWATEGEFMIADEVDHLIVTPGMTLYTQGEKAHFQFIDQKGGTVELTSSAPLNVDSYFVKSPSNINVVWDKQTETPLMTTKFAKIESDVSVELSLSELSNDIKTGDHVTLIKTENGTLNRFKKAVQTFGATFDLETGDDSKQVTLTLTGRGVNSRGLSSTALALLAHHSLNSATSLGQHLTVMDTHVAETTLNHIASSGYLRPINTAPLSFDAMRLSNYQYQPSGLISSAQHTAVHIQNASGAKIGDHALIGISATDAPAVFERRATVWGIHGLYHHIAADGFATNDGNLYGARIGINYGQVQDGSISFDLTTQINKRSGSYDSALGHVFTKNIHETRIISNVALKKRFESVEFVGQIFSEIHAFRNAYSVFINHENITIPLQSLPLSYGIQLQTSFDFKYEGFTGAYVISHENQAFSQKINLMYNIKL
jgi:hypothetical protein